MTMKPCIAVFDVGTSSVKTCLFTPELEMIARSAQEYPLHTHGDEVEAWAQDYLAAAQAGMGQVVAQAPGYEVAAIAVTTQGETLVPVDDAGRPLRSFLVWLDSRAQTQAQALSRTLGDIYPTTGLPEINGALPLAKLLWIREKQPKIWEKTEKFLLLEDYFLYWMTGNFVSEKSLQTSTGWFSLGCDDLWEQALEAVGADRDRFPRLLESGQPAGTLTEDCAKALGLKAGIPVIAGAMDQTAAALAAGCVRPGSVTETTGSALVMAACTDAPDFSGAHHVTVYRHVFPGKYLYLPIGNTGGMALRWFRDEFCRDLPGGEAGYEAINREVCRIPAGCEGLIFLPYLAGSVDPDNCPYARGCFFGARLSSTRGHFARSVMESIAFQLRDFLEMLEGLGCTGNHICSMGGGAASPVWMQIKADVCGRAFRVTPCQETTAMGAALLAGWGSGLIPADRMPDGAEGKCYLPDETLRQTYDQSYRIYRELYSAVKPLYQQLGGI